MTENKRFTVEKIELVSDHLSTRFFIKDNLDESCYDVRHMISQGYEVQFDTWAEKIADKWNELVQENEQLKQQVDEMIIIFENSGLDYHISDELNEILNR